MKIRNVGVIVSSIASLLSISLYIFLYTPQVFADTPTQEPKPSSSPRTELRPSDVVIPPEIGYIVETSSPEQGSTDTPLIIHIQEAHVNYEAQQHLVAMLQRFVEQLRLKLILVEGGQGDVGLKSLRQLGSLNQRKKISDKYLKLGLISAEEYLDVVSDYPLILWGIEETELYQKNVDAFLEVESLRQTIDPLLRSVHETVDSLNPGIQDPALAELQAKAKDFEEERLGVNEYATYLSELAKSNGVAHDAYPNVRAFLDVRTLEQAVRPDAISQEQRALFQRLRLGGKSQALDRLLSEAKAAGKDNPEPFYFGLERLAKEAGVDLEANSPELSGYLRYLKRRRDVNPTVLANELDQLTTALRAHLAASTPQRQQLAEVADQLDLMEKLAEIKLNPQEYERLSAVDLASCSGRWSSMLNALLAAQGMPARSFEPLAGLNTALPRLKNFYEAAKARDAAMVERTIDKLHETRERLAVLITGGFHSPAITRMLKEHQLHLVVVAPKVTQATDEALYRKILRLKNDRTTDSEEIRRMVAEADAATPIPAGGGTAR